MDDLFRYSVDAMVWAALAAVMFNILPVLAVAFGVAWHAYQIYDLYDRRRKGKKNVG